MNKQEPKNKAWALKKIDEEIEEAQLLKSAEYNEGYEDGCQFSQRVIDMMDEPQKPVIPPELAEYIQDNEGESIGDVFSYEWLTHYDNQQLGDKVAKWLFDNDKDENNRRYLIAVQAFITGDYEVEKEPLYNVIINGRYLAKMSNFSDVVILVSEDEVSECATESYELTEKQIKAIDERYWPFAVPVEEVAEG